MANSVSQGAESNTGVSHLHLKMSRRHGSAKVQMGEILVPIYRLPLLVV